jgi:hypothetical protein
MTEKMGPDEEKSDFELLAFLMLYYINKACVKILWQYQSTFRDMAILYISLTIDLAFIFY